ncbi:alpha/beta hydrolase family protein [Leucobacter luti]|uniref:alpha/beta hydrolase n=1 Tax=Leucobacter luti TaxID=340320 RepID=UPI00104F0D64|nr:alpha/beta hydrolase [Leucobacter luti]MCW2288830.1 hypothetical protein [Leucobacter luti]TCK45019.1 alpha/beta hydrolase family protein [Leucobacter luti]
MTWVPSSAAEAGVLSTPSPIKGNVDEINRAASYAQKAADDSFGYRSYVQSAERNLASGQGDVLTRLQGKLTDTLVPGVNLLDESVVAAKKGFDSYASEVERIHKDARKVISDIDDDLSTIRTQAGTIAEIAQTIRAGVPGSWNTPPPGTMPEPRLGSNASVLDSDEQELRRRMLTSQYSMQWLSAAMRWKNACDDIDTAKTRWSTLVSERRDAEQRLLGALGDTYLGRLLAAGETSQWSAKQMITMGLSGELRGESGIADGTANPAVEDLLARTDLSGEELTEAWNALGLSKSDVAALPVATLAQLASRNGLPAWAQDVASTELLHYSLIAPNEAYPLFGFGTSGPGVQEFRTQIGQLYGAWQDAKSAARLMGGEPIVQLLALGSHDGAMTAAISHGDLDTASHVGVNVSGMLSNVGDIGQDARGARSLYNEAYAEDWTQTYAAVTWIGYKSPDFGNVNFMGRADAGGPRLAAFIDGIYESRAGNHTPMSNFTVFAHSYGSTTAAVALTDVKHPINSFVTYGSAGLSADTPISGLKTDKVFSTHAAGDQTAGFGQLWSHPVVPTEQPFYSLLAPEGAPELKVFSAEGGDGYTRVTAHDMFTEDDSPSGLNWGGKVGYLTTGTRSAEDMGKIWANGGL